MDLLLFLESYESVFDCYFSGMIFIFIVSYALCSYCFLYLIVIFLI